MLSRLNVKSRDWLCCGGGGGDVTGSLHLIEKSICLRLVYYIIKIPFKYMFTKSNRKVQQSSLHIEQGVLRIVAVIILEKKGGGTSESGCTCNRTKRAGSLKFTSVCLYFLA